MGHIQTQEEWEVQMAEKILSYVRNELYLELRYLDVAFSALVPPGGCVSAELCHGRGTSVLLHRADTACV